MAPINTQLFFQVCGKADKLVDCAAKKTYSAIEGFGSRNGKLTVSGIRGTTTIIVKDDYVVKLSTTIKGTGHLKTVTKYVNRTSVAHAARVGCSPWWIQVDGSDVLQTECGCIRGAFAKDYPLPVTSLSKTEASCQPARPADSARFADFDKQLKKLRADYEKQLEKLRDDLEDVKGREAELKKELKIAKRIEKDLRTTVTDQAVTIARLNTDAKAAAKAAAFPSTPDPTPNLTPDPFDSKNVAGSKKRTLISGKKIREGTSGSNAASTKVTSSTVTKNPASSASATKRRFHDEDEDKNENLETKRPVKRSCVAEKTVPASISSSSLSSLSSLTSDSITTIPDDSPATKRRARDEEAGEEDEDDLPVKRRRTPKKSA